MDYADSQHLSRISKMLLAGIGVAFAWVLLSFTVGLSVSQANAADDGLLERVASTVDETAAAVAAPVVDTVAPVVAPATNTAPSAPVVEVVQSTVATAPDLSAGGIVAPISDATLGVVAAVPVVGEVVSALGADTAVSALGTNVDGILTGATTAVDTTVTDIVGTTGRVIDDPAVPPLPGLAATLGVATAIAGSDAAAGPLEVLARAAYLSGAAAWTSFSSDLSTVLPSPDSVIVSGGASGGIFALLRSALQADSVFMGPSGAGPGAWVLVALGFVVAYRAWMRRSGLENDVAPPAPVLSTDVSPD